jgi:two-component system NtrC family sensor kinase
MAKFKLGLGTKLVICMIGSMLVVFVPLTVLTFIEHQRHLQDMVIDSALRVADTIKVSTHYDMLHKTAKDGSAGGASPVRSNVDPPVEIKNLIESISRQNGIERIRIYNKEGKIIFSTDPQEVNELIDKEAQGCSTCHETEEPLRKLEKEQRWRIFRAEDGHRVLGLIDTFENDSRCNACHVSKAESLLGVLDVNMSLMQVDSQIASDLTGLVVAYVLALAAISLVSGGFVFIMVHQPVKKLIEGTEQVARGDLTYRLNLKSGDEIGTLAESFNNMTSDLKSARDEITNWTRTLEKRVSEKSEELKKAQEGIIRVEKMASLGKLSAIVAHEINNPLMGVLTYAKLLAKKLERKLERGEITGDKDIEECDKYLSIIQSETSRCGEIVKNLLLFSKKSEIHAQACDLNEILEKSVMLVSHQMELQSIECLTEYDAGLPQVTCDTGQIQQMMVALLINACEAVNERGRIEVKSRFSRKEERVTIVVADNGVGMDEETKKHIFEPFYTTKEGGAATGLGLAVVYGIVERHGGSIRVDSDKGAGTEITITLPLRPPEEVLLKPLGPITRPPERL